MKWKDWQMLIAYLGAVINALLMMAVNPDSSLILAVIFCLFHIVMLRTGDSAKDES